MSAGTRATIYRYLAAFVGFVVLGILAAPAASTLTDLWHAAVAAIPLAIEKLLAMPTNAAATITAGTVANPKVKR